MNDSHLQNLLELLEGSVQITEGRAEVLNHDLLKANIHKLAEISSLESGGRQGYARYLIRLIGISLKIFPASIHELYMARGRNEIPPSFTVPAINLRALSFDAAKAVFRAASPMNANAIIFEIARSEMGYTDQKPAEYASNILAAAIAEGYSGPVFIQGDHFQVSLKKYNSQPDVEINSINELIVESIAAGFLNIDIDTSTLVDLSKETIPEQQKLNTSLSATFTKFIREHQPSDINISVGGEIGEVGGQNSTEEELRVYMDNYNQYLQELDPNAAGLSKISIQTGTSHGGVVLPDGSIAKVKIDFDTLLHLSRVARNDYGMAGAVQHGASTLPDDAFSKFVESEACEVHLATNFQNMMFDRLPDDLRQEIYAYLDKNHANERKPGMSDEQFYYKTRKRALGVFKKQLWNLPAENKAEICSAWENQFHKLFVSLGIQGTNEIVNKTISPIFIQPDIEYYLGIKESSDDVSDLAD
jgi:fructose/tagatose bisphosphate aldolase